MPSTPFPRLRTVALAANLLVFGFVFGLGTWSIFAPLESAAIALGTVESESSRKTIQHLEGGIVREILVRDGDVVHAGQTLVRLDDIKPRADVQSQLNQLLDATAREARLHAEQHGHEHVSFPEELTKLESASSTAAAVLAAQRNIFETRRRLFQSQLAVVREKQLQVEKEIAGLKAQETAATERAEIIRDETETVVYLVNKGLERRTRLLALKRELTEVEGRRGETTAQISRAEQVIGEMQTTLLKMENDRQNEVAQSMREARNQIFLLRERKQAADDQLARTEVKALEDGIVTELRVHTVGGVIAAGAPLMDIVPRHDRLIVTARVRPEDIDVVHPGLTADVHLMPYNQRRVPYLKGTVTHVSADRLVDKRTDQPYYAAKIRVQSDVPGLLENFQIVPGMPAQVFIKTGVSTVAIYAFKPLLASFNGAFRED
jgi:HlyD family secretion protein